MPDIAYDPNYRYISITQINQLLGCPMQWYLQRRAKVKGLQPVSFLLGATLHETEEHFLTRRMNGEEDWKLIDLLDDFDKCWAGQMKEVKESPKYTGIDWSDSIQKQIVTPELVQANGRQMIAAFHKHINPLLDPIYTEQMFHLDIPGAPGWKLTIKMDMVGRNPDLDGAISLYDHKTAVFPWKKGKADDELQATGTIAAWNLMHPDDPVWIFVYNIVTKGIFGKTVQAYQETTERTPADVDYFWEQVRQCIRLVRGGGFVMQPDWSKHKYCPFMSSCPAGHLNQPKVVEQIAVGEVEL